MNQIINNIKIFCSFWFLLFFYFIIPIFIDSISAPSWIYYLDSKIPFIPFMVIPYFFYYIIIILPPFIWKDQWSLRHVTSVLNVITLICYLIFILWPIDATHILDQVESSNYGVIDFLHNCITYDYLFQNAFPSMHVSVTTFICFAYYYDFKDYRFIALLIAFLIFLATFLIKQHYFIDSIAGFLIGLFGCYYYYMKNKPCK